MMQAIISGHLGRFATRSGTAHLLFDLECEDGREVSTNQLGYAFQGGKDAYCVDVRSIGEARAITRSARDADIAVRLFILLLDSRDSDEERRELAEDLEILFQSAPIRKHVAKSFYSHPFAPSFDILRAKRATSGLTALDDFLEELVDHQGAIEVVRRGFDAIPFSIFKDEDALVKAREFAIGVGCFFALSRGVRAGDAGAAILHAYQTLRGLSNSRELVGSWTEGFQKANLRLPKRNQKAEELDTIADGPYFGRGARRAFEEAMGQQPTIIEKLKSGDIDLAKRFADELVASQRVNSAPADIAKSLCRLSKEAQRVGIVSLHYEWSLLASEICPEDPMTHGHLMDALIHLNRIGEASQVLERVRTSAPSYYATGYARILRSQGRLVEAEAAYRDAILKYAGYDDAYHAHAGLGGTLRELGKLDESLEVYEQAIKNISEEAILLSGFAASLVEVGRFAEARQNYLRASGHGSFDRLIALNGLASISKLTGDFEQAEREYNRIIANYEHDSFAANGLADLRRLQGRHVDAIRLYKRAIVRFPHSPVPHLGIAETLRDQNKALEALAGLEAAIKKFPHETRLAVAYASALRQAGRRREALQAINYVVSTAPKNIAVALEVGQALKALGKDEQALRVYNAVIAEAPHNVHARVAKASLLAIAGKFDDALATIDPISSDTQWGWRAENLRALMELRSGNIDGAKARAEAALKAVRFDKEKRMIKSTLAAILVKQKAHATAVQILSPPDRRDDEITRIVRLHASAFLARTAATRAYLGTKDLTGPLSAVREQIGVQLGLVKNTSPQPRGWLENSVQLAALREAA